MKEIHYTLVPKKLSCNYSRITLYPLQTEMDHIRSYSVLMICPSSPLLAHLSPLHSSSTVSFILSVCSSKGLVLGLRGNESSKCDMHISPRPCLHHVPGSSEKHHSDVSLYRASCWYKMHWPYTNSTFAVSWQTLMAGKRCLWQINQYYYIWIMLLYSVLLSSMIIIKLYPIC